MGLLDDAIRQHLDLKRRTGADERQLAQLEHEAFGPIRRGDPALDVAPPAVPESPAEEFAADEVLEYEVSSADPAPAAHDEPAWDAGLEIELADEAEWELEPAASEPVEAQPLDQPTSAYSLDDLEELDVVDPAPADAPASATPGEHDVLEETPEFLEETPEHDRLWFEQKPPKDFEF